MFKRICLFLVSLMVVFMFIGCGNVTPPGKIVIILKPNQEMEIVTKGVYKAWNRDRVYFVDQKLKSFSEQLKILCKDDVNMTVDVKSLLSFNVDGDNLEYIKNKVPAKKVSSDGDIDGFELSLDEFYKMAVKDIIRGSVRNIISKENTEEIKTKREDLEKQIQVLVTKRIKELGFPIKLSAILISNLDYPEVVTKMREEIKNAQLEDQKAAALAEAEIAKAKRNVIVETEKAKMRMVKAKAQAEENKILANSLSPQFLMWKQFEVQENLAEKLAAGASNTVYMMPYELMDRGVVNSSIIADRK